MRFADYVNAYGETEQLLCYIGWDMPGAVLSVWKPDLDVSGQLYAYDTGVERMRLGNHIKPKRETEQQFGDFSDDM